MDCSVFCDDARIVSAFGSSGQLCQIVIFHESSWCVLKKNIGWGADIVLTYLYSFWAIVKSESCPVTAFLFHQICISSIQF